MGLLIYWVIRSDWKAATVSCDLRFCIFLETGRRKVIRIIAGFSCMENSGCCFGCGGNNFYWL